MRRLYILLASVMIATLLIAVASSAGASAAPRQQPETFAALWASTSLQNSYPGFATNLSDANAYAYNRCLRAGNANPEEYQDDCAPGVWVENGYMAFAMDVSANTWGTGWGHTRGRALREARNVCRQEGGTTCDDITHVYRTRAYDPNQPTDGGIPPGETAL
jgi:hypothetical protein